MNAPSAASATSTADTGRQAHGRFARGNSLGTGNPFARQVAALRAALIESVTAQDIKDIACILLLNAKAGDLPSIKLLFQYVLGKPQPAVNPDTLDREEMKGFQQESLQPQDMDALRSGVPASAVLPYQRIFVEAQERQLGEVCLEQMRQQEQEQAEEETTTPPTEKEAVTPAGKPARRTRSAANEAPSTNGSDGDWREPEPSVNGDSDGASAALFRWLRGLPAAPQRDSGS